MSTSEWDGILREGEKVLWQGKPDPGFYVDPSRRNAFGMGVLFAIIGFAMLLAAGANGEPGGVLFSLAFTGFGLYHALSQSWWQTRKRRHTFYSLTNQRAILGIALPGHERTLKTFEITPDGDFELRDGNPGSIIFAFEDEGLKINERTQYFAAGFLRIDEARKVWEMIHALQNERR
ncbi:MAG TPA: hypothetical protein ENK80_05890, partial [Rhodobacterales bacterium]|nr:hypothetical protein [Rhodobacterales bacterium]